MHLEKYDIRADEFLMEFQFVSIGTKGEIIKIVRYSKTNFKNIYNLALVDKDPVTNQFSDAIISDNGDTQKVLVTVAMTTVKFFEERPNSQVFFKGLTASRTRLWQMNIAKYLNEIIQVIDIKGLGTRGWETFQKGVNYEAFIVNKKA